MSTHSSKTTTDHDEIRRWAEARKARPARVKGTGSGNDPGMIRLDFPGYSGAGSLEEIPWDEWFQSFDDNALALVYQEKTAEGKRSNFNKLVGRDTAEKRTHGDNHASRHHGAGRRSTSARKAATRSTRKAATKSARSASASSGRKSARKTASKSGGARKRRTSTHARKTASR